MKTLCETMVCEVDVVEKSSLWMMHLQKVMLCWPEA